MIFFMIFYDFLWFLWFYEYNNNLESMIRSNCKRPTPPTAMDGLLNGPTGTGPGAQGIREPLDQWLFDCHLLLDNQTTHNDHKETQNHHKKTLHDYKEMQNNHKET